jgi:Tn3 transposase DDE domain-containing protein
VTTLSAKTKHSGQSITRAHQHYAPDLHYGKGGDLTGPDREHAEVSMLALHLLQASLVHLNTALVQIVLSEPEWAARMTDADRRALTPLFWTHVNLYGKFDLDMSSQLGLGAGPNTATSINEPAIAGVGGATSGRVP